MADTASAPYRSAAELETRLDHVRESPSDEGRVILIVRRPARDHREIVEEGLLDPEWGLEGDTWRERGSGARPDGMPDPRAQVTLMSSRFTTLIAGDDRDLWALAGDQLYVDLDLSEENLAPGSRLAIGSAVLEVSDLPHTGCAKFSARFGSDALRVANSPVGRALRLRGVNATVVEAGTVRTGDIVRRV